MWISDTSINRPVFATMVIMSFMVLGAVSMTRLGIDLFPEVNFPFVNVTVIYPGAGPEEVETLVTRPIEDAVAGINGVKKVISTSTEGVARIGVELRLEVDPQAATAEVREKVAAIRGTLPGDIEDPTIQRFDVAALPIMMFAVGSTQPSDADTPTGRGRSQAAPRADRRRRGGGGQRRRGPRDPGQPRSAPARSAQPAAEPGRGQARRRKSRRPRRPGQARRTSISLRTKGEFQTRREIENVILRSARGLDRAPQGRRPGRRRLRGQDVDDASERRRRGVVLGPQAVGRQHRARSPIASTRRSRGSHRHSRGSRSAGHNDADFIKENVRDVRGTHLLRRSDGGAHHLRLHARLALDADLGAGAADLGGRHLLLHVGRGVHHQHDDA